MLFKYNKQDGIKDCGTCCLYNIIRYYKGNINFEKLRKLLETDKNGTNILNIVNISNKLGLESKAYKCEFNDLKFQHFPIVIHIKVNEVYSHFVIIYKIKKDIIYIFDPIRGYIKYNKKLFLKEWSNIIITFNKTDSLVKEENNYYKYISIFIKKNKKNIIIISFLSILYSILISINSIYITFLINNIYQKKYLLLTYLLLIILQLSIGYIKNNFIINFNKKIDLKLMKETFNHLLHLPISYHHSRPTGDIVSRVYDLYYLKDFINELFINILIDALSIIVIFTFIFHINHLLFLITLLISIIYFIIYYLFRDKINNYLLKNQQCQSEVNSVMVEDLLGIDSIKNLGLEKQFFDKFINLYNKNLNNNNKLNNILNNYSLLSEFIKMIYIIIVFSIFIISDKKIQPLFSMYILLNSLFCSYQKIITIDNLVINSNNSYKRINDLLSIEKEENIPNNNRFFNTILYNNFKYSNFTSNPNNKLNLKINPKDYILITGKSGIGKSTLFKALTKQIDIKDNSILLDKKSINNYSNKYIRNKICYVSQNEYIFTDSIKNNILMHQDISNNKLNKILKICMVDKILKDRNIDINYLLEENGHNLSGGERQKILLARTLVKNSDFIILDETMNEIDIESERKIIKNIKTEYNNTLILISHRLDNKDLFNKFVKL